MNPVTNTNYVASIKNRWLASGHPTIAQLLQAHMGDGEPPVPTVGDQAVCLSWILKGRCHEGCPQAGSHRQASQALVAQVHALLDACGVAPSN